MIEIDHAAATPSKPVNRQSAVDDHGQKASPRWPQQKRNELFLRITIPSQLFHDPSAVDDEDPLRRDEDAPLVVVRVQDEDEPADTERDAAAPCRRRRVAGGADPARPAGPQRRGPQGLRPVPPEPPPPRLRRGLARPLEARDEPPVPLAEARLPLRVVRLARPRGGVAPPHPVREPVRRPRDGGAGGVVSVVAVAGGLLPPAGRTAREGAGSRLRTAAGASEGVPDAPRRQRPAGGGAEGGGARRRADRCHAAVRPHELERRQGVELDGAEALPRARD